MSRLLIELAPVMQERATTFLARTRAAGYRVMITQTRRTIDEQNRLFAQGRYTPGKVITNAPGGYSWHNFGLAFDIAFVLPDGQITWEGPWAEVGQLGTDLGLMWGGDFVHFPDRPHFEFHNGQTLASLREHVSLIG